MKNRLLTLAGALALVAVLGKFYAVPALAQAVRAALVQNIDERGRNPYYQTVSCYSATSNQCYALFPPVPANMRLVVEFVASDVDTPTPLSVAEFFTAGGFVPILHTLQGNDPAGNKIYVANQPWRYYFEAGQQPYIVMNAQAGSFEFMSGSVTVTGYLVNLTQ
jgi:hypothetical protein